MSDKIRTACLYIGTDRIYVTVNNVFMKNKACFRGVIRLYRSMCF